MNKNFTYNDFNQKLKQSGLSDQFSEADLKLAQQNPDAGIGLISAKQEFAAATTEAERQKANQKAETLRMTYGNYSSGQEGNAYVPGKKSPGTFSYDSFSYDPQEDALYQAYKKQYTREGRRASEDTMGIMASMTGGRPSSYAASSAAQSANQYAAALTDKIPELQAQRYNQYENDRKFAYNQYTDEYSSKQKESEQQWTDAISAAEFGDYRLLNNLGVNTENYMKERAFQNKLDQQETENQLDLASLAASLKDYDKVNSLTGIKADNSGENLDLLYSIAAQLAKAGDYSLMYHLMNQLL